jgi:hypothetical protein
LLRRCLLDLVGSGWGWVGFARVVLLCSECGRKCGDARCNYSLSKSTYFIVKTIECMKEIVDKGGLWKVTLGDWYTSTLTLDVRIPRLLVSTVNSKIDRSNYECFLSHGSNFEAYTFDKVNLKLRILRFHDLPSVHGRWCDHRWSSLFWLIGKRCWYMIIVYRSSYWLAQW